MNSTRHKGYPVCLFLNGNYCNGNCSTTVLYLPHVLLLGGFLLQQFSLIGLGIILFSFAVAFQVITLPVEFNASSRAKDFMIAEGIIRNEEERGVNKVL